MDKYAHDYSAHIYIILSYFLCQYTQPFFPVGSVIQSTIKKMQYKEKTCANNETNIYQAAPLPTQ
jgi:hypothetical protein